MKGNIKANITVPLWGEFASGQWYLPFVRGIHWWPVDYPNKGPVMWKAFPHHDIMNFVCSNVFNVSFYLVFIFMDLISKINSFHGIWFHEVSENIVVGSDNGLLHNPGLILGLHPANERRHCKITASLISWVQTLQRDAISHWLRAFWLVS